MVKVEPKDTVETMVKEMEFERGYFWDEIKNSKDYETFKTFLLMRWLKLLFAVVFTFGVIYALVYFFHMFKED
jgi:hypothetical protein